MTSHRQFLDKAIEHVQKVGPTCCVSYFVWLQVRCNVAMPFWILLLHGMVIIIELAAAVGWERFHVGLVGLRSSSNGVGNV